MRGNETNHRFRYMPPVVEDYLLLQEDKNKDENIEYDED